MRVAEPEELARAAGSADAEGLAGPGEFAEPERLVGLVGPAELWGVGWVGGRTQVPVPG